MFKKVIATGLMLTVMLSASACGKEPSGASGTAVDTPVESSTVESQPTEEETKDLVVESSQSTEEGAESTAEEDASVSASYIFSDMPIAVYEVTGLGVGPDAEFYDETIIDTEDGYDFGAVPLVKLDSSNTFVLFCLQGEEGEDYMSMATIHSPSGSSQWEANGYTCLDVIMPEVEGYSSGYPCLTRWNTYNEESSSGSFESLVDPWTEYIRFAEIYHPDAPQEDTIYVIEVIPYIYEEDYDEVGEVMTEMVCTFEKLGATNVQEIPVEEALERFNIIVSEEGAD